MYIRFTASESVEMLVEEQPVPIEHYLCQPECLVQAIADPKLIEQLSPERFCLKMLPLNFMDMYHFQPIVVLKVWAGANGTIYLNSEECEIRGLDFIQEKFTLNFQGKLSPRQIKGKTYLQGKGDLFVKVELPPALWLMPKPLLEMAGNGLLKNVLSRIKQRLLGQLLQDYRQWALNVRQLKVLTTADSAITQTI